MLHHPTKRSYVPDPARPRSSAVEQALAEAVQLAQEAHDNGRLLTPAEAMALAGPEARSKETLYSVARTIGWRREVDVEDLLAGLGEQFPEYR